MLFAQALPARGGALHGIEVGEGRAEAAASTDGSERAGQRGFSHAALAAYERNNDCHFATTPGLFCSARYCNRVW
jgi:hypothetical protein